MIKFSSQSVHRFLTKKTGKQETHILRIFDSKYIHCIALCSPTIIIIINKDQELGDIFSSRLVYFKHESTITLILHFFENLYVIYSMKIYPIVIFFSYICTNCLNLLYSSQCYIVATHNFLIIFVYILRNEPGFFKLIYEYSEIRRLKSIFNK